MFFRFLLAPFFIGVLLLCCAPPSFADADDEVSPIISAASDDQWDKVFAMIEKNTSAVNETDFEGFSLLSMAAIANRDDVVSKLLKLGANKNAKDISGRRPYDQAVENGKVSKKILKMLK